MPLEPGTKLGPYEILGPIGAGGMGEVYRARDERLSRAVAVKVLPRAVVGDPDRLRRFEQEARAAGQLNHPNIVVVYDTGTHDGAPYVVEELLEGETLRQRMGGIPLPARKAIEYARQIAEGLAAAHQKGIVHRDLKPENLFLTGDGRVKILDFGLAKLSRPEGSASMLTQMPTQAETGAGVVLGTVGYMAPEQVRGQHADHRSDIFSLGAILYEMVAGRRAFQAASAVETMNAILGEEPPPVWRESGEIPAGLERIVEHCLEKRPDERFQSARDLAFQLEAISSPTVTHVGSRPSRQRARSPVWRAALLLTALAALLAGAFWAGRRWSPPAEPAVYSQLTFRQGRIFTARFTPDGETVVYGAAWEGRPAELFSTRPGSPESRPMGLQSAEILSISRAGEMAVLMDSFFTLGFMRSGTLARAPLAGGAPRPILEDVEDADWSPSGDGLAVVRDVGGRYRLEFPAGKVLYETEAWISSVRFSRDGQRIGYIDHPNLGDNRGRVAVVDLEGNLKLLTAPFSSSGGLAWSPTGDEIWFTAGLTGNVQALHAVDLEGRLRIVDGAPANLGLQDVSANGRILMTRDTWRRGIAGLAPGAQAERDLSWHDWSRPGDLSDDGEWLLFEEQGQGGGPGYSVYLRRTDGSPAVRLGSGSSLDLSPDGNWALTLPVDRGDRLIVLPRGPGEARTLDLPGLNIFVAGWFPDGRRLLVLANEAKKLTTLYVMDSEDAKPRPLSQPGMTYGGAISPDGRLVAASPRAGAPLLFPVDGGEPRPLPGSRQGDVLAGWSQDGRSIFVAPRGVMPARIDRIDPVTGERALWKEVAPADRAGLIDIAFVTVSADTRAYIYSYRQLLSTLYLVEGLR